MHTQEHQVRVMFESSQSVRWSRFSRNDSRFTHVSLFSFVLPLSPNKEKPRTSTKIAQACSRLRSIARVYWQARLFVSNAVKTKSKVTDSDVQTAPKRQWLMFAWKLQTDFHWNEIQLNSVYSQSTVCKVNVLWWAHSACVVLVLWLQCCTGN